MLRVSWPIVYKAGIAGVALYALSLIAYTHQSVEPIIFACLGVAFFFLARRNMRDGLGLLLIELIVSSHGHLLSLFNGRLSLRVLWFTLALVVYVSRTRIRVRSLRGVLKDDLLLPWVIFFLIVIYGVARGVGLGNGWNDVFLDANGYIYLLLAPLYIRHIQGQGSRRFFVSVMIGALCALSLMVVTLFLVFSNIYLESLTWMYRWARDTRLAEITWAGSRYFRVFLPSQLWLIVGVIGSFHVYREIRDKAYLALSGIFLATLFLSLSRSFGVGLVIGLGIYCMLVWRAGYSLMHVGLHLVRVLGVAFACIVILVFIPGNVGGIGGSALLSRITNGGEPGIQSRLAQFMPLVRASLIHPVLGSGFGSKATYISYDPRVRATSPDGSYTTYSFELGYLDIWLKLGLLGLIALGMGVYQLTKGLFSIKKEGWVWVAGLGAVLATHAFSPYLNHPLGIGYIVLTLSVLHGYRLDTHSEL